MNDKTLILGSQVIQNLRRPTMLPPLGTRMVQARRQQVRSFGKGASMLSNVFQIVLDFEKQHGGSGLH
jgi:hypothetical protein